MADLTCSQTEDYLECPICFEGMKDIGFFVSNSDESGNICNHSFCFECIKLYFPQAVTTGCPVCRIIPRNFGRNRIANTLLEKLIDTRRKGGNVEEHQLLLRRAEEKFLQASESERSMHVKLERLCEEKSQLDAIVSELRSKDLLKESRHNELELQLKNRDNNIAAISRAVEEHRSTNRSLREALEKHQATLSLLQQQNLKYEQMHKRFEQEKEESQKDIVRQLINVNEELKRANHEKAIYYKLYQQLQQEQRRKHKQKLLGKEKSQDNAEPSAKLTQAISSPSLISTGHSTKNSASNSVSPHTRKNDNNSTTTAVKDGRNFYFGKAYEAVSSYFGASPAGNFFSSNAKGLPTEIYGYKLLERRGESTTSQVWRVSKCDNVFALKRISINSTGPTTSTNRQRSAISAFREAMLLERLEHPNIIQCHGILPYMVQSIGMPLNIASEVILVLDFVELDAEFLASTTKLSSTETRYILFQVLNALFFIHTNDVAHRGIANTCILLDKHYNVKLACWSHARALDSLPIPAVALIDSSPAMLRARAPELFSDPVHITAGMWKAADIWALGCVFFEILTGKPLFAGGDPITHLKSIVALEESSPKPTELSEHSPPDLKMLINGTKATYSLPTLLPSQSINEKGINLLVRMMAFDNVKRITALEALQHSFFDDISKSSVVVKSLPKLTDEHIRPYALKRYGVEL